MLRELSEDLSRIKKIQSEMKDSLVKRKNNIQGDNSRVTKAENQIKDLEHKQKTSNQNNNKKKELKKNRDRVSSRWDNFKHSNTHIIRVPEEKRKSQKLKLYLKK